MRIIIAPAKQMKTDLDSFAPESLPVFIEKAEALKDYINSLSYEGQKKLWACNDKIAAENSRRFSDMDLRRALTPAIIAYDGIQYTYMAAEVFENRQFDYVNAHLRILSGFYGVLKPMDGVVPYRLEMQAKTKIDGFKNLYEFWGDSLYREVLPEDGVIVNLASKEYSKCVEKFLQSRDRFVNVVFGELIDGKVVQKGVYAKMARGEMVRFAADINAQSPNDLKSFNIRGYAFDELRSTENEFIFIK
ncbi:MAG TPA: peroxide stress protein YaaA [Ruminococcaceae bacterium]|nr:peroxide stress protein YaaA [Oscillospiraceae bacterium]